MYQIRAEIARLLRATGDPPVAGHLVEQVRHVDVRVHEQPRGGSAGPHRRADRQRRVRLLLLLLLLLLDGCRADRRWGRDVVQGFGPAG